MAYTTFSTDNADYVLQLGNHVRENRQVDIFEGIDGLVVETGSYKLQDCVTISHPQLELPFGYCAENKIPIFGTDVRETSLWIMRYIISGPIEIPPGTISLYYGLSDKKVGECILNICAHFEFVAQTAITEGRNAINARKIEEFVAPLMAYQLGRKPYLGLIFGAGHMGLKPDLQSKRRRDFTLWNWRNFNFRKWAGFVEEDLNRVDEANHDGKEWKTLIYTTKLFD